MNKMIPKTFYSFISIDNLLLDINKIYFDKIKYYNKLFYKSLKNKNYLINNIDEDKIETLINALVDVNKVHLNNKEINSKINTTNINSKFKKFKSNLSKLNFVENKDTNNEELNNLNNAINYFDYFKTPSILKKLNVNKNYENGKFFNFEMNYINEDENFQNLEFHENYKDYENQNKYENKEVENFLYDYDNNENNSENNFQLLEISDNEYN